MNNNEVRWKLHNYFVDAKKIEQLKDDLREYRLMDGVGAQLLSGMPINHNDSSVVERIADKLDYIRELESELDKLLRMKRAIDSVYLYLQEPARTIIEMRYFLFRNPKDVRQQKYNWMEIADETNYSEAYCKEIDCKVILKIQNKLHEISYI